LFAVLVHQGAHDSGHYFAYVKSFEDGQWYKLNDREVLLIPESTVETAFGRKYSDASAYLLQYRKVHPRFELSTLNTRQVPAEFEAEIREQWGSLIKEQSEIYEQMLKLPLTVYLDVDKEPIKVHAIKTWTLAQLSATVFEQLQSELGLKGITTDNLQRNTRLREYDDKKKVKMHVYDEYPATLNKIKMHSVIPLILEIKTDDEEFEVYDPHWMTLKVVEFKDGFEGD